MPETSIRRNPMILILDKSLQVRYLFMGESRANTFIVPALGEHGVSQIDASLAHALVEFRTRKTSTVAFKECARQLPQVR